MGAHHTDGPAAQALAVQLDAPTRLQPGESGMWEIWGASVSDIRTGDVVVTKDGDTLILEEVATIEDQLVRRMITTPDGVRFSMGLGSRQFVLFRQGTKNTLA